ncbi:Swt1 family HEPN domain-containing protein [Streptomyces chartreusis]|uniref:Swt1 family HEPN domain-containing protein n=1 Tax=Streptomyces chartreusis TaxID=1969 RepID=UPI002E7FE61B|nr:Swt1 family HEPN domain-containing protein [Streptomyces chartreusis]WUB19512.1 Swt1 family HEPN domain-containing protein [Streptomyces chartreusis]
MSASNPPNDQPQQLESSFEQETRDALRAVVPNVMPERSLALYARWWQLEAWLRELIYVELRSLYGAMWIEKLRAASGRQTQDAAYRHMSTADSENPLAYLDYSQLMPVIENHWDQLHYALLERKSWDGRQEELKRVRHRIGHIRKSHPDDLGRIEQTLRDLEEGAFIACASYNRRTTPRKDKSSDAVTTGWIAGEHATARRLVRHAEVQYGIGLQVDVSRRPWADWPDDFDGAKGILWHAAFYLRERTVDLHAIWNELRGIHPLLVHVLATDPHQVQFTFSSVDDSDAISDAIGFCFDALIYCSRRRSDLPGIVDMDDHAFMDWRAGVNSIDYRVMSGSGWSFVDETTLPISMFGAGGGVRILPNW